MCKHPPVKGKLKDSVELWESVLQTSPFIIDTITNGYPIPLASIPPMYKSDNYASAIENSIFVNEVLTDFVTLVIV